MFRHTEQEKRKISEASVQHWEDKEYRDKVVNGIKNSYTSELRELRSATLKEKWKDPAFRNRMIEERRNRYRTKEAKEKHSKLMQKVRRDDPDISIRQSESIKKAMSTPEYRKKRSELSKAMWDDAHRKNQSRISKEMWSNMSEEKRINRIRKISTFSKNTTIEVIVQRQLNDAGIRYETQVPILNGRYFLDIVLIDYNIAIECNGDYWHNLPNRKERDKRLIKDIAKTPYTLVVIWEHEIRDSNFNILNFLPLKEDEKCIVKNMKR